MKRALGDGEKDRENLRILKTTRAVVGDITLVLHTPKRLSRKRNKSSEKHDSGVFGRRKAFKATACDGKQLSNDDDTYVDYVVTFDPPILYEDACVSSLDARYSGSKNCTGSIHLNLVPEGPVSTRILKEGELEYLVYPTHQLQVTNATTAPHSRDERVLRLFFRAENNLLYSGGESDIKLQPALDMGALVLAPAFGPRFRGIEFFPPNINPADHGLDIDARDIPQRTTLWFKMRAEVSGSKSYKLMGFWVPSKTSKEGRDWSYDKPEKFSPFQRTRMRFGSLSEDACIAGYLTQYPRRTFTEVGSCSVPLSLGYPANWGASPDGLVTDPTMTLSKIPAKFREHLAAYPKDANFDYTKGVVEFKCSTKKLSLDAYFFPQVYMEMMATNTVWCDLVRYRRSSCKNGLTGKWEYTHEFRVYRIYRHKPTEDLLVKCLRHAAAHTKTLQDVVQGKEFRIVREFFETLASARSASEFTMVKVKNAKTGEILERKKRNYETITITSKLGAVLSDLGDVRANVSRNGLPPTTIPITKKDSVGGLDRMWMDMEDRWDTMKDMFHDAAKGDETSVENNSRAEFVHLASLHIQDLARLIDMALE